MTIQELYKDSFEYEEILLIQIIELLVEDKKVLFWDDHIEKLEQLLTPPEGHYEAWNERYKQVLRERRKTA